MEGVQRQVFRPTVGRWLGYAWLVFVALNLADLAWRGDSRQAWVIGAVLLLATALVYVAALRPRIVADSSGLRIINPLREVAVPWGAVTEVDAMDSVRVHTGDGRAYRCWAVHAPNRQRRRAYNRRRRGAVGGSPAGNPRGASSAPRADVTATAAGRTRAEYVAEQLAEMAREGRHDAPAGRTESVVWSPWALGALGVGVVLVLAAALVP